MPPSSRLHRRLGCLALASLAALVAVGGGGAGLAAAMPSPAAGSATQPAGHSVQATQAGHGVPADEAARGLVHAGLRRANADEECRGRYEFTLASGETGCTHGPDPAPEGVDVRQRSATPPPEPVTVAAPPALTCQGDGTSGNRVQLVYARAGNVADRYSSMLASFRLWAAQMDEMVNLSAAETGGVRHIRFVHDAQCVPSVLNVTLSNTGDDNLTNTINELRNMGYSRTDRKYLLWVDANVYCGIAEVYNDERATQNNYNNGVAGIPGMVARVDNGCWGYANSVEAHELVHTFGSVQDGAPHATPNGHCSDDYDRMCYKDAGSVVMTYPCASAHEARLDCNHDDYFSTAPAGGSYLATHWNTANSSFLTSSAGTAPPPRAGGGYYPLTPARILDTRNGTGAPAGKLGQAATLELQVTGQGGVPASGVSAVVLNVTVTEPTAPGYLTAWPTGVALPLAANLTFVAGQTVPNLVVVKVGTGGKVSLYNAVGATHVVADVGGYYGPEGAAGGASYTSLSPARVLDTRNGTGAPVGKLGQGSSMDLQVTGQGGVPASGVSAVVLNVTVTEPTAPSFLTAWPTGVALPLAANLTYLPGQTVPNLVIVKVGTGGKVSLYNSAGSTHVVADVAGWYGLDGVPGGAGYTPVTPSRILDTRNGLGGILGLLGQAATTAVQVTGVGGVPASGVSAVVLNVTVTQPSAPSFLTAWPLGIVLPLAANLTYLPGQTVPNLVVVQVGQGGKINLYNAVGSTHVVADVAGWF